MYTILHYTADNTRTSYDDLTKEQAEQLFKELEAELLANEQVIMLHGLTFICSGTKR